MENDQMRAQLVRELGAGATIKHGSKCAEIIFDNESTIVADLEDRLPVCTMLTSEVACLNLQPETVVQVFNPFDSVTKSYRVRRIEPDGTGMSRVVFGAS